MSIKSRYNSSQVNNSSAFSCITLQDFQLKSKTNCCSIFTQLGFGGKEIILAYLAFLSANIFTTLILVRFNAFMQID